LLFWKIATPTTSQISEKNALLQMYLGTILVEWTG